MLPQEAEGVGAWEGREAFSRGLTITCRENWNMTVATAIYWLIALTLGVIVHVVRDMRRYNELKRLIEEKQ